MDLMYLFTSFEGRIGRQQWWLGTIVMIVAILILSFVILPLLGLSMMSGFDPSHGPAALSGMFRRAAIAQLVLTAVIAYPTTALMKKRLNDRDRPAWFVYLFWAPTVLSLLLGLTGLSYKMTDMGGAMMPSPSPIGWIVNLASFIIGVWALVELGFLKGTNGANQHGPDPLVD